MDVFDLSAKITLDTTAYEQGLSNAARSAHSFGDTAMGALGGLAKMSALAFGATAAAAGTFSVNAVNAGKSFDAAMGQVAATAGMTAEELEGMTGRVNTQFGEFEGTLRDFAKFMGQNTAFSATEAAQALNYMALAGYNTQQSMEMLPSVLNMAAAGSMDLARASDMITDTQSALGLSFERTDLLVNEFAKAASTGNTSVEQLGEAFLRVGGLAAETNGGFITLANGEQAVVDNVQEMEIAFTAMANAGVKGAEAGTHMRNMIMKLSSPTADGAMALERLGVAVFDDSGQMRSLVDIMGDLKTGLDGVTQQEKLDAISNIFNARDIASAEALLAAVDQDWNAIGESILNAWYDQSTFEEGLAGIGTSLDEVKSRFAGLGISAEQFDAMLISSGGDAEMLMEGLWEAAEAGVTFDDVVKAMGTDAEGLDVIFGNMAGAAGQMADTQLDNLAGSITKFQSALEGAYIEVSDKITPTLKEFVDLGTSGLADITKAFQEGGLEGAFGAFGDWLSKLTEKVTEALPGVVSAVTSLLGAFVQGIIDNQGLILEAAGEIISVLLDGISAGLDNTGDGGGLVAFVDSLIGIIDKNLDKLLTVGVKLITSLLDGMTNSLPKILPKIAEVIVKIAKALTDPNNIKMVVNSAVNIILALVRGLTEALPILIEALPEIITNVVTAITDSLPLIVNGIVELMTMLLTFMPEIITVITSALPQIIDAIVNGIIDALPILIDGLVQVTMLLVEHLPEIVMALIEAIPVIITSIVGAFDKLGPALVQSFKVGFNNLSTQLKEWFAGIKDEILTKLADFIVSAEDWWHGFMGDVKQWLKDLPYNIGLALGDVITKCIDWCADTIQWAKDNVPTIIDNIVQWFHDLPGKIKDKFFEIITKIGEWVDETKADIDNFIQSFIKPIVDAFEDLPVKAVQWGKDMIANFIQGIKDSIPSVEESLTNLGDTIKNLIGFSEPKEGPLSNFHTFAPDMMELFAEGVDENKQMLHDEVAKAFDFSDVMTAPTMQMDSTGDINSSYRAEDVYMPQMITLLQQILEKDNGVVLAPDTAEIFSVVEKENRKQMKATGYNQLAMMEV